MHEAFICDAVRTPFGRYGGALSPIRADDLAAIPIRALIERNPAVDWLTVDDVIYGCANQAGEDNRNVGRMALLLAGLPEQVPGATINRLCGSSLDSVATASRAIKSGEADLIIAGGVESMSRAPFVLAKADTAFGRNTALYDTTLGWRFVNPVMEKHYGIDSMAETAENVAAQFNIARKDQDAFALRSQQRWAEANRNGFFKEEIVAVAVPQKKGDPKLIDTDEQPRPDTTADRLARLPTIVRQCFRNQRRSWSSFIGFAESAQASSPESEGPRAGCNHCRHCPANHGIRSSSGYAQDPRKDRINAQPDRCI